MIPTALHLSDAEISALLGTFLWPLFRVMGLLIADPLFGTRSIPRKFKVGMAIVITVLITPSLPPMPAVAVISGTGLLMIAQQLIIGMSLGFIMRMTITVVEMAGFLISTQMGLGFAMLFDPQHNSQVPTISRLLSLMVFMMLLAMDGHHLILSTLIDSFRLFPISPDFLPRIGFRQLADWGSKMFSLGLLLSMPVVGALLIINLAIGVMTRAAPQFNIFSFGFPLTLLAGFIALYLSLPSFADGIIQLYREGTAMMLTLLKARAG